MKQSKNTRQVRTKCLRKAGEAAYLSYILLTALGLILGGIVLVWMTGYVKESGSDVKNVVYNYEKCDSISVSIDNACSDNQYVYLNITNRNNLRVNAFIITIFDNKGLPAVIELNSTIKPEKQKELKIEANISNASSMQAVPIMYKDNLVMICTNKKAVSTIQSC